jgi:uncharacterized Zn-binding protein involved in type VI secretion
MPLILRLGDPGSHGGSVCTSATKTYAESVLIARIGDTYCCPLHGPNPIITGCSKTYIESALCAYNGSMAACGATLSATATKTYVEGG